LNREFNDCSQADINQMIQKYSSVIKSIDSTKFANKVMKTIANKKWWEFWK
jgi:hypothetical protein